MPVRILALSLLATVVAACAGTRTLEGMTPLESARTYSEWDHHQEALDMAEEVREASDISPEDKTDATYVAAESALALGRHLKAYRLYREILQDAPWSPYTVVIEDRLFDIGKAFLFLEEYGGWFDSRTRGVEVLETLQLHYRRSDKADDALRLVGDYFGGEDVREWLEAALTYERLFREYPESEWAELSLWNAGHFRLRLVYGPQYNRQEMLHAQHLLELSLEVHPRGVAARQARADLASVLDLLARGEVLVADFYRARDNIPGERLRLANAALTYPETGAGLLAAKRLAAMGLDLAEIAAQPRLSSRDTLQPVLEEGVFQ
jgi:tetratricopeptide (TPR) repeat protein